MKPEDIVWTCWACPMQAEGQLPDGRWYYFRYRFGRASLGLGVTEEESVIDQHAKSIAYGDSLDGVLEMEIAEGLFMDLLRERLAMETEAPTTEFSYTPGALKFCSVCGKRLEKHPVSGMPACILHGDVIVREDEAVFRLVRNFKEPDPIVIVTGRDTVILRDGHGGAWAYNPEDRNQRKGDYGNG